MNVIKVKAIARSALAAAPLLFLWAANSVVPAASGGPSQGNGGAVIEVSTPAELHAAIASVGSNATVLIAPGTYPLAATLNVSGSLRNVVIRGATSNPDDVVLVGRGMANADFGSVPHGISIGGSVSGITISNLTIRDVYQHAIVLEGTAQGVHISNVRLLNAGHQFVKVNSAGAGALEGSADGVVEHSTIEYTTTAPGTTAGIDVSGGLRWKIRKNLFRNLKAPAGQMAAPAVLLWQQSRDSIVEGNTFINCQREIALGFERRSPYDHVGGSVRNNFIYREPALHADVAIQVVDSPNTEVLHNTVLASGTAASLIEARGRLTVGAAIAHNLLDGQVAVRDGAVATNQQNYTAATADMFVNAAAGDLHLAGRATAVIDVLPTLRAAGMDWDGQARPLGKAADYGADEYIRTASEPTVPPPVIVPAPTPTPPDGGTPSTPAPAPRDPLPAPWETQDIGQPALAGAAHVASEIFTLTSVGTDVWDAADSFRFVHQPLSGDGSITACVAAIDAMHSWTKAGVMMRESLAAGSPHAFVFVTPGRGLALQYRMQADQPTVHAADTSAKPPHCLRLVRQGNQFTAFQSADGSNWVAVGSQTIAMGGDIQVGLALSNPHASQTATAMLDRVLATGGGSSNQKPAVTLTSPADGASYAAPATITLAANASDADGAVRAVDFFAGSSLIATDTSSPYTVTWTKVPAGSYSLTAVARDDRGASSTSAPVEIKVSTAVNQPPYVTLTGVSDGASFNAPAQIAMGAQAGDADGSIAKVEFYAGSTVIGSDSTAPFTAVWKDAAPGSYTLSAKAWDDAGASTISAGVTVTVRAVVPETLPVPWLTQDIGLPSVAGNAGYAGEVFTLSGASSDIWENADKFRFVYQPFTGDGAVSTCVAAIDPMHPWAKAGVMFRESLAAGSRHAFALISSGHGAAFQYRAHTDQMSRHNADALAKTPHCVRLVRQGNLFTAYQSTDGSNWQLMGSQTLGMAATGFVGLALSNPDSRMAGARLDRVSVAGVASNQPPLVALTDILEGAQFTAPARITMGATASDPDGSVTKVEFYAGSELIGTDFSSPFSATWNNAPAGTYTLSAKAWDNAGGSTISAGVNVSISDSAPPSLPEPWKTQDVGQPALAGAASHTSGLFTLSGAGKDVWDSADQFRFVYQPFTGDGEVTACVATLDPVHLWTKAGVMFRDNLDAGSVHAFAFVTPGKGVAFQYRAAAGGQSGQSGIAAAFAPHCVRLVRQGDVFTAYEGSDETSWLVIGTQVLQMNETAYVGLALTSHDTAKLAKATFDGVSVAAAKPNQPPVISLTSPSGGAAFTAPATVTITATASDPDGSIAVVDFYEGATKIGSDTSSPYTFTWTNVAAGSYSIAAVARDNLGGSTASTPIAITVSAAVPGPPRFVVFHPSVDHSTVTTYAVEFFKAGDNAATATPTLVLDIGKPAPINGDITVDVSGTIQSLAPGTYFSTVTATSSGGTSRSTPSEVFVR